MRFLRIDYLTLSKGTLPKNIKNWKNKAPCYIDLDTVSFIQESNVCKGLWCVIPETKAVEGLVVTEETAMQIVSLLPQEDGVAEKVKVYE